MLTRRVFAAVMSALALAMQPAFANDITRLSPTMLGQLGSTGDCTFTQLGSGILKCAVTTYVASAAGDNSTTTFSFSGLPATTDPTRVTVFLGLLPQATASFSLNLGATPPTVTFGSAPPAGVYPVVQVGSAANALNAPVTIPIATATTQGATTVGGTAAGSAARIDQLPASVTGLRKGAGAGTADTAAMDGKDILSPATGSPRFANNAAVAAMVTLVPRFRRDGFAAPNDGGAADYSTTATTSGCPLNSGAGDGGGTIGIGSAGSWVGCAYLDFGTQGGVSTAVWGVLPTGNDVTANLQAAINSTNSCLHLYTPRGTYAITGFVALRGCLHFQGAGKGLTVFKKGGTAGNGTFYLPGGSTTYDVDLDSFTIDVGNIDTGINVADVNRFTMRNVSILNMYTWGININGTPAENQASTIINDYIDIEDCDFNTSSQTYEQILLINSRHVRLSRDKFLNGPAHGIGIGVFQNDDGVTCDGCLFQNMNIGAYYGVSSNNVSFVNSRFENNTTGLQGINASDNGQFGATKLTSLLVAGSRFVGNTTGAEIGGVYGATISDTVFSKNVANALVVDGGNVPNAKVLPIGLKLSNVDFIDNNQSASLYTLHPAILFQGIGGQLNATMTNVNFLDDQSNPTQANPITFEGDFAWSNLQILGGNLQPYLGANLISLSDGATVSAIKIYGGMNVGPVPSGVAQN